jgi:GNAT superfamily N-acetyltransferase
LNITFELAKPEDAKEIYKIQQLAYKEQLDMYKNYDTSFASEGIDWVLFRINNHMYYKILLDGKLVGQIDIYQHRRSDTHYEVNGIFVHPEYQNRGIGKSAMKFVEEKYSDAKTWTIWTPHRTYKNHYFCERLGYKKTGKEEKISESLILIQYERRIDS